MSSQLTRCHAGNKRSMKPVEIFLTSLNGRLGQKMDSEMKGVYRRWKRVNISSEPFETVLKDVEPENLIYLTADSENVIQSLEINKVYVIGGIVDKNRHKVHLPSLERVNLRNYVTRKL
jgi:tRNA (guanine9-N1)-methyltransferase